MRNAFSKTVTELALKDPRVVMLSGDIGNRLFDKFKAQTPERFFNCGVAEANLIGLAAGMAMNGLRPIAYTITPFITYRCYEQIRVDVCYHNLPVTIVGVGSGLGYGSLGATHHSCEDIACMRALPNLKVVCPGDPSEVIAAVTAALDEPGPVYIRIGKKGEPEVHALDQGINSFCSKFHIGKSIPVKQGSDITILSTGTVLPQAMQIAASLTEHSVEVISMHTVKPLDTECLEKVFNQRKLVVTLEEHSLIGGFGSAVGEWLIDTAPSLANKLLRIGTPDKFAHGAGETEDILAAWGLSNEQIVTRITARL